MSVIIYIYVSFSMRMLLSDIWSRSNFWVTVHASWVLMSVKQLIHSPIYRLNQSLLLQMLASFARSVWMILMIFVALEMAFEMSQEFPTVSLDITNKASLRLSLVEKFAKIASALLSLQRLWSVDTVLWLCPSQLWNITMALIAAHLNAEVILVATV